MTTHTLPSGSLLELSSHKRSVIGRCGGNSFEFSFKRAIDLEDGADQTEKIIKSLIIYAERSYNANNSRITS